MKQQHRTIILRRNEQKPAHFHSLLVIISIESICMSITRILDCLKNIFLLIFKWTPGRPEWQNNNISITNNDGRLSKKRPYRSRQPVSHANTHLHIPANCSVFLISSVVVPGIIARIVASIIAGVVARTSVISRIIGLMAVARLIARARATTVAVIRSMATWMGQCNCQHGGQYENLY